MNRGSDRELIMWNLITLNGYFEGPTKWDLGWHEYAWGEELDRFGLEQLASADTLVFGRVTYEGMASHWPSAKGEVADRMNAIRKIVFSRTLEKADWDNTTLSRGPAEEEVPRLKRQPGKDMFIFGSADLSAALSRHRLIDEYRLCLTPIVLRDGNPLFKPGGEPLKMTLVESRPLRKGCVILRYRPVPE